MEIEYDRTQEDLFSWFNFLRNRINHTNKVTIWSERIMSISWSAALTLSGTVALDIVFFDITTEHSDDLWMAVFFLIFVHHVSILFYYRSWRKAVTENCEILLGPHKVSMSQSGIVENTNFSERRYPWSVIQFVTEENKHVFLQIANCSAIQIPSRAFSSKGEKLWVLENINESISSI